jgi:hypothetical protein
VKVEADGVKRGHVIIAAAYRYIIVDERNPEIILGL